MKKNSVHQENLKKRKRRTFDEWFAEAKAYQLTYGNLLVPNDYVTPEGNKLGRWIERKRGQYNGVKSINGHICSDEIAALEAIGMVWKLEYRFEWDEWIEQAALYYNTYGHLNVPKEYANGIYSLGHWLIEQRQKYAVGELLPWQIDDLEKYHVCWKLHTPRSWNEWYTIAHKYYEINGNLRVPVNYRTGDGLRLGKWICSQRECYQGRPGKRRLTEEEIEKLEEIGMIWSISQEKNAYWKRMLEYAKEYISAYDRLPTRTAEKILTKEGHNLANWVCAQQERYRKGLLSDERISALMEAGIIERRKRKKSEKSSLIYNRNDTGARIRRMRILLKVSSGEAAGDLRIAERDYMDIENGRNDMSLDTAIKIALYYHVSLEYLAYGRERLSGFPYARESEAILLMLKHSGAEKRAHVVEILQSCLAE